MLVLRQVRREAVPSNSVTLRSISLSEIGEDREVASRQTAVVGDRRARVRVLLWCASAKVNLACLAAGAVSGKAWWREKGEYATSAQAAKRVQRQACGREKNGTIRCAATAKYQRLQLDKALGRALRRGGHH